MRVSIIIPVFNERSTLDEIVRRVLAAPLGEHEREVVLVDDCSTDGSAEIAARLVAAHPEVVRLIRHENNRGKGAAIRTGFAAATGDILLIQDADLEYDPAEYPRLLAPILDGRADAVFGSRFVGGEAHRVLYYWHSVANRALTTLSNAMTNLNLTDIECCYKVFTRDVAGKLRIEESGFGVEPELTARVARLRCRVFEVGVSYSGRTYEQGKKIRPRDGAWAVWCILKYNLMG
jgi:glycosyltransferase involved in cell wall biosynthesis